MYHYVARASGRRLLFATWPEGLLLWRTILRAAPGPIALCVMPNHLHLLTTNQVSGRVGAALSGFARGWHSRHGTGGELFGRHPPVDLVNSQEKQRRVHRYVVLNPCRAGLTPDPLAWPLSTYLDDVGLSAPAARRRMTDVYRHHQYVHRDDTVKRRDLPEANVDPPAADAIVRAVSHATRTPLTDVPTTRRARDLAAQSAHRLHGWSIRKISAELGISYGTVRRAIAIHNPAVDVVARLAGDDRIAGLDDSQLARMLSQSRYRGFSQPPRLRATLGRQSR